MPLNLSGDIAGLGKIVQIVRATDSTQRTTTSTTFGDVTGMSVTITPSKSTSAILLVCSVSLSPQAGSNNWMAIRLTDASNNPISGAEDIDFGIFNSSSNFHGGLTVLAYSTPATTTATTYKMQAKVNASGVTGYIKNDINTGQLYAIEVAE